MGILVGGGINWEKSNSTADEVFGATADVTFDFGGANVFGAFYWDNVDDGSNTFNPYGFTVQGGVFVADDVEIIARYEFGSMDSGASEEFSALTFGANWYLAQNTAKFGANFGYAFDAISDAWETAGAGNNWLADDSAEDGQWMIQAQLSFSF